MHICERIFLYLTQSTLRDSVLNYRIPLTVTAIHQFIAFLVFLPVEIKRHYSGLARRQEESEKKGLRANSSFFGSYIPRDVTCCRFTAIVFGLAIFSALNYGLVAVALMRLSLADHQVFYLSPFHDPTPIHHYSLAASKKSIFDSPLFVVPAH